MIWRVVLTPLLCISAVASFPGIRAAESPWLSPMPDNGFRLWMDASGMHVIEASLQSQSSGSATLKRIDGTTMTLGKVKLSIADRDHLMALESDAVAANDTAVSSLPSTVRQYLSINVDRVTSSASARDVTQSLPSMWKSVAIPIDQNARGLPLDRNGRLAIVTSDIKASDDNDSSLSTIVDTQTNVAIASIDWPTKTRVLDYDALADTLLIGAGVQRSTRSSDDAFGFLIALKGLRGFKLLGVGYVDAAFFLRPEDVFGSQTFGKQNEMFSGGGIAGDRMLVKKFDRVVGVIVGKGKPLWAYPLENAKPIAISPDRRFFAASDPQVIGVVDIATGKMIRELATNDGEVRRCLAFSPDGRKLAATTKARIEVWNLSESARITDASHRPFTESSANSSVFRGNESDLLWLNDDDLLMNGQYVFHVPAENFVWKYSTVHGFRSPRGLTRVTAQSDHGQLIGYDLPHPATKDAITAIGASPQTVLIDSSAPTQVLVDGPPDAYGYLETIATAVGKRSRWNLQPKADVSLIARVQQVDEPIQIKIRYMTTREFPIGGSSMMGRGGPFGGGMFPPNFGPQISNRIVTPSTRPLKAMDVRPYFCEFEIRHDGKTLWSWRNVLQPDATFTAREGESETQISDRVIQPNYDAMKAVYLPQKIVDETEIVTLRTSTITENAIVD